jgi:hypothetical protein
MKLDGILSSAAEIVPGCDWRCIDKESEVSGIRMDDKSLEEGPFAYFYQGGIAEKANGTGADACCIGLKKYAVDARNYLFVSDTAELQKVHEVIERFFAVGQALLELAQRSTFYEYSLQQVVDRATEILGNPVMVLDPNFTILAISSAKVEDPAWQKFLQLGRVPYHPDMVEEYGEFLEEVRHRKFVKMVDGMHKKRYFIRCAVMAGKRCVGQLQLHSGFRNLYPIDLEFARYLSVIVSGHVMSHSPENGVEYSSDDFLVSDLIHGKITDPDQIRDRTGQMGWQMDGSMYLLLVQWKGQYKDINRRDQVAGRLSGMLPNARTILDGTVMVSLFSVPQEIRHDSVLLSNVRDYLEQVSLYGVVSMPIHRLEDCAYFYRETKDILDLNRQLGREDRLVMAEACVFELLIHEGTQEYRADDFIHPLVKWLIEYDRREGKDYAKTLRAYIFANGSFSKAADILHMHRNTVIYRMKQIEELLEYDFSRLEFNFHFELSFRILDYMESLQSGVWKKDENVEGLPVD